MMSICPGCEKETHVDLVRGSEPFEVRGEKIEIVAEYRRCSECGAEFENTRDNDALAQAYREFRQRHNMLQPEHIQEWRKGLGILQKELSALLGWGGATLSRYENGALQDEAHEKMLRMAMEPHNLLSLIKETPSAFSPEKRERLIQELEAVEAEAFSINRIFEDRLGGYLPDEFSGFLKFDMQKFHNAVLFFCKGGQLKTKLNKLLFYADFKHFRENTISITGARYVHLPHGPVPDNYEYFFATLIHTGEMDVDEIPVYQYFGENYTAAREADLSIFEPSELKNLAEVKEYFKEFSATQIRDFSHEERGYSETENHRPISFLFAEDLRI
jgi:putative zinc finger/helix-turn-helix YgiT family protein